MTVRRIVGIETEYGVLRTDGVHSNAMLLSSLVVSAHLPQQPQAGRARWDYTDEDPLADARGFRLPRAAAHPSLLTNDPSRPVASPEDHAAGASPEEFFSAQAAEFELSAGSGLTPQATAVPATEAAATVFNGARTLQAVAVPRPERPRYDDPGAANVIVTSGARIYVDHAHPEYCSPEVTNPLDVVTWDAAGELHMDHSVQHLANREEDPVAVALFKNNVDGKGASYGTHENFLVARSLPFDALVAGVTPFLVTRQVFAGSGRVGLGPRSERAGFQLAQRSDYMEAEVGLETTLRRPIVNTRDEPHADPVRWRRLHLIIGDANRFQTATYLKVGTTSLLLWFLELTSIEVQEVTGVHPRTDLSDLHARLLNLKLADPVAEVSRISHDPTLRHEVQLADGRKLTALQVQREIEQILRAAVARQYPQGPDHDTADLLDRWDEVLTGLETDPKLVSRYVEWVAKYVLFNRLRERLGAEWDHPKLVALDLQWTDISAQDSLFAKLDKSGAVHHEVSGDAVGQAKTAPPQDTRAYLRGELIRRFGPQVVGASWDSVILDLPERSDLLRLALPEPAAGGRAEYGSKLEAAQDLSDFIARA